MRHFYVLFFLLLPIITVAQQLPLGQQAMNDFNILVQGSDTTLYTGYRSSDWLEFRSALGNKQQDAGDRMFGLAADVKSDFGHRIFTDHWLRYESKDFLLTADPYLDVTGGKSDQKDGILWNGTAGLIIRGTFRNRLSFGLGGYTSLSEFPAYLDKFISENESMIPGRNQGQRKDEGRYAYSNIDAYLTYMPDRHILLTAGYGKQFIGDGYRSLLWSDNAFNYPYIRLKASFWKLNYNVMYSYLENDRIVDGTRQGKYSVSHYLGINIGKRLQVSLFENILWLARDTNYQRGFDVQYVNPITFMRPVEFSLGSPDNSFFGLNWKYSIPRVGYVYGQLALDDININESFKNKKQHLNNKYGIQLGIWTHDVFLKGLSWRLEWNAVRPYMYGHRKPDQNYAHNHQALAHPFGANFHEFLSIFNYRRDRWYGVLHNALVIRGEDSTLGYNNGNDLWGGEAGVPLLGSKTMQGIRNNYWYNRLSLGYMLNPANRLSIQLDIVNRSRSATGINESEWYLGFGIRTGLFNRQDDL